MFCLIAGEGLMYVHYNLQNSRRELRFLRIFTLLVHNTIHRDSFEIFNSFPLKIVSEYDQKVPQSRTAAKPMAHRGRATQQSRDTRKTN